MGIIEMLSEVVKTKDDILKLVKPKERKEIKTLLEEKLENQLAGCLARVLNELEIIKENLKKS